MLSRAQDEAKWYSARKSAQDLNSYFNDQPGGQSEVCCTIHPYSMIMMLYCGHLCFVQVLVVGRPTILSVRRTGNFCSRCCVLTVRSNRPRTWTHISTRSPDRAHILYCQRRRNHLRRCGLALVGSVYACYRVLSFSSHESLEESRIQIIFLWGGRFDPRLSSGSDDIFCINDGFCADAARARGER